MNTTVSKSFGLALLLAVGIIAVLVAMGAFTSQRAAADVTAASIAADPSTVNEQAEITITLTEEAALSDTNDIIVTFPAKFTLGEPTTTTIAGTGTVNSIDVAVTAPGIVSYGNGKATIDIGAIEDAQEVSVATFKAATSITIVIEKGTKSDEGITLPSIAATYEVTIGSDVSGSASKKANLTVAPTPATLAVNPTGAGAAAAVTVSFTETATAGSVDPGDTISIKLKDFGVPSTIPASSVLIRGTGTGEVAKDTPAGSVSKTAEGVSVSADTISITIPDMVEGGSDNGLEYGELITVLLRQSAGITLPTAAGGYPAVITVTRGAVEGADKATNDITIFRALSLSPTSGAKGTSVTASGKGWGSSGPVVLWVDDGTGTLDANDDKVLDGKDNGLRDGLEVTLAENVAVSGGAFSATFTADFSEDTKIQARDAAGNNLFDLTPGRIDDREVFTVEGSLSLDKDSVKVNEKLEITLSEYKPGTVIKVTIGGVTQDVPDDDDQVVDGKATFTISVKPATPVGTQVVSVTAGGATAAEQETTTATVSVAAVPMTVSPTTAALNQEVTVSATGFTATTNTSDTEVAKVTVNGVPVDTDSNQNALSDTVADNNGNINISFNVPTNAGTGEVLIQITEQTRTGDSAAVPGRIGEAIITIPSPTLTLSTSESRRNSRVTASGTGFVANDSILLNYEIPDGGKIRSVATATTDSVGAWSVQFVVPVDAKIGKTSKVKAESSTKDNGDPVATKSADHKVPGATITLDPTTAASGETIKISGTSFPAYSAADSLEIGGIGLSTVGIQTNGEGFFSADVTVPQLPAGTHNIRVTVGGQTDSEQLVIPLDTTQTVEDVFADLIANESLQTIWRYDFDTRTWTSYTTDPETSFANDLFEVESSDILNINVSSEQTFSHQKGSSLFEGWNLITLN